MNGRTCSMCVATVAIGATMMFGAGGCETIGQDINEFVAGIKPVSPTDAARDMINPYDADKRRTGATQISTSTFGGGEVYVKYYRDLVDNERDPVVKAIAIRALARHGAPDDAVRIMPYLVHENVQVRWEAAKAMQRLHYEPVVPELLKILRKEDEHSDVRIAAASALGQYPQDRVFQGLVGALESRELAINLAAAQSLSTLTAQEFGIDSAQWLAWYNSGAAGGQPFAAQHEYLYPVYSRDDLWWEKIMFWTSRNFEQPGVPAGLRARTERSTYQDEPATRKSATP